MRTLIYSALVLAIAVESKAQSSQCTFVNGATPAFCDTFDTAHPGQRGGDLDPAKWTFYRSTENFNPSQGRLFNFYPVTSEHCDILVSGVIPDRDSFFCGPEFGEHQYWITSMNDNGAFVWMGARSLQPFDFTNRTGTIVFNVDATTNGIHTMWPQLVIADAPEPNAHESNTASTGIGSRPRNGISINFGGQNCVQEPAAGKFPGDTTKSTAGLEAIVVFRNYQEFYTSDPPANQSGCYTVQAGHQNHFEIRLSQDTLEVWASDAPDDDGIGTVGPNFRRILVENNLGLTFTRGYVYFQHVQYDAAKFGNGITPMHSFHWSSLGFDGPVLPAQRAYQVADPLTPAENGSVQVGYWLDTPGLTFQVNNVDPSNAAAAWLTFNFEDITGIAPVQFRYRLNGRAWNTFTDPKSSPGSGTAGIIMPVNLNDLMPGTNTIELMTGNTAAGIANVDLLIDPAPGAQPPPTPSPTTIGGVQATGITTNGATILWSTNNPADSQVAFGFTATYGFASALNSVLTTSHSVVLTGLAAGTLYHFRVESRDSSGNLVVGSDQTFTTAAPPPSPSPTTISGVQATGISANGATIVWSTNNPADSQVEYGSTAAYALTSILNPAFLTSHSVSLTGLTSGTLYHYRVESRDSTGTLVTSPDQTFTTLATPPPPVAGTLLVGTNAIENGQDSNDPGVAEAFRYTALQSGTAKSLNIYLDAANAAHAVVVGIYAHNSKTNSPSTLLAQATITNPVVGAWNSVAIPGVSLHANTFYWIAILGPVGTGAVQFRDVPNGAGAVDQTSAQTNLTTLPATWVRGRVFNASPMSAFASQ